MSKLIKDINNFIKIHGNNNNSSLKLLDNCKKNSYPIPLRDTLGRDYYNQYNSKLQKL